MLGVHPAFPAVHDDVVHLQVLGTAGARTFQTLRDHRECNWSDQAWHSVGGMSISIIAAGWRRRAAHLRQVRVVEAEVEVHEGAAHWHLVRTLLELLR